MIPRINSIKPLPDYMLAVAFDDGKRATYDVKGDICDSPFICGGKALRIVLAYAAQSMLY